MNGKHGAVNGNACGIGCRIQRWNSTRSNRHLTGWRERSERGSKKRNGSSKERLHEMRRNVGRRKNKETFRRVSLKFGKHSLVSARGTALTDQASQVLTKRNRVMSGRMILFLSHQLVKRLDRWNRKLLTKY